VAEYPCFEAFLNTTGSQTPDQPEQINDPGFEAMVEKDQGTHGRG
jgi:hypothetical protein